jgi:geranylgeranyl pyrophosphate synthase
MQAFNAWLHVPQPKLQIIGRVIAMLHNASLLIDDIEDNSQLRRGRPGTSLRSTPPFQDSFLVKLRTRFMVSHRLSTLLTMFTSWPFKKSSP